MLHINDFDKKYLCSYMSYIYKVCTPDDKDGKKNKTLFLSPLSKWQLEAALTIVIFRLSEAVCTIRYKSNNIWLFT